MKHLARWAAVAALPVLLSACAGYELQHSVGLKPPNDPFFQTAYASYLDRAHYEADSGDQVSADLFSVKARQAANGTVPVPFVANDAGSPPKGTVQPNVLAELVPARAELVSMLGGPDRNLVPSAAAQALVMYDCWVEEESYTGDFWNAYQPDHAAFCKDGHLAAMKTINDARPRPVAAAPNPTPAPAVANSYLVFFDWDQSTLTSQGRDVIRQAAANAKSGRPNRIQATGHIDTSGTTQYNVGLSERRAEAVKAALIAEGIPAANIGIDWKGESVPLVSTGDGVREPQNRRAEIVFQK